MYLRDTKVGGHNVDYLKYDDNLYELHELKKTYKCY